LPGVRDVFRILVEEGLVAIEETGVEPVFH
jgi:hypothetical protein